MLSDSLPLHEQVSATIIDRIRTGEYRIGSKLPAESALMVQFQVSRGTVRRALKTLGDSGFIQTFQGKGAFVAAGNPERSIGQKLVGIGENLTYSEKGMKTVVLKKEILLGSDIEEDRIESEEDEKILFLDRIRILNGIAVARLHNWVRISYAPGIEECDFTSRSLFNALDEFAIQKVSSGQRSFEAVSASEDVAQSLKLATSAPLLHIRQTTFLDDGSPIEWSNVWLDSRQVTVTAMLSR